MVKYNEDLTIEEAQKIIDKNKETNGAGKEEEQGPIFSRLRGKLEKPKQQDQDQATKSWYRKNN